MAEITFRPANPADTEAIRLCIARAFASALQDIADLPDVTSGIGEDIAAHDVTVAQEGPRILGVIIFGAVADAVMIFNLAVLPETQGRGVARRLLEIAESSARNRNRPYLRLRTHKLMQDTRSIYSHLGWAEVELAENTVLLQKAVSAEVTSS